MSDAALLAAFTAASGSAVLAPGALVTFTINNVSLTLVDGTPGSDPLVNTVTVNATDDEGTAASGDDTATINVTDAAPAITIVKSVDAERRRRLQRQRDARGKTQSRELSVRGDQNTSNAAKTLLTVSALPTPTLNAAGVSDAALLGGVGGERRQRGAGSGRVVAVPLNDVSLTLDDGTPGPDPFVNTVTVNATDDEGAAATDTDTATINVTAVAPAITVVKSVDADGDAVFNDSETVPEGTRTVDYQFAVYERESVEHGPADGERVYRPDAEYGGGDRCGAAGGGDCGQRRQRGAGSRPVGDVLHQ